MLTSVPLVTTYSLKRRSTPPARDCSLLSDSNQRPIAENVTKNWIRFSCEQERNGYLPPAKDPDWQNRLKQVYGSMPPQLTPEYKTTDRYITQLKVRERKEGRLRGLEVVFVQ